MRIRAWLFLVALAACASPAAAQSWLYAVANDNPGNAYSPPTAGPSRLIEVEVANGVLAGARRQATVPGVSFGNVVVTSDGRYVAWTVGPPGSPAAPRQLAVFDRRTGAAFNTGITANGTLIADPARVRVFVVGGGSVSSIDPAGPSVVWTLAADLSGLTMSLDGRRFFASRPGFIVEIDAESGTELRSISVPGGETAGPAAFNRDGSELFAVRTPGPLGRSRCGSSM